MITLTGVDDEELYRLHATELTRYATGLVEPFGAAGVVTDACVRAVKSGHWDQVANRRAYLYKSVLAVASDHQRRTLAQRVRKGKSAASDSIPASVVDVDVLGAVNRLSVHQRAAVFLTYWEDLTTEVVAERMGISVGSVKRHLAQARKSLGEVLS